MKVLLALALLKVVTAGVFVNQKAHCDFFCVENYDPVCGSDGKTYDNQCALDIAKCKTGTVTFSHHGLCMAKREHCSRFCVAGNDPVCGSDGKTYSNRCLIQYRNYDNHCINNIWVVHEGICY